MQIGFCARYGWLKYRPCGHSVIMYVTPISLGSISRTNEIAASELSSYGGKFASALRTAIFVFFYTQEEVFTFGVKKAIHGVHFTWFYM